jgi:hypothetical protein
MVEGQDGCVRVRARKRWVGEGGYGAGFGRWMGGVLWDTPGLSGNT